MMMMTMKTAMGGQEDGGGGGEKQGLTMVMVLVRADSPFYTKHLCEQGQRPWAESCCQSTVSVSPPLPSESEETKIKQHPLKTL